MYTDNEELEFLGDKDQDEGDDEEANFFKNKQSKHIVEENKEDIVDENGCPIDCKDSDDDMDEFEMPDSEGVNDPAATPNDQMD